MCVHTFFLFKIKRTISRDINICVFFVCILIYQGFHVSAPYGHHMCVYGAPCMCNIYIYVCVRYWTSYILCHVSIASWIKRNIAQAISLLQPHAI